MGIAWMYREDYSRAGYLVLPAGKLRNRFVNWQSFVVSLVLVPVSLIPTIGGGSGLVYSGGALFLGSFLLSFSGRFSFRKPNFSPPQLLAASILFFPFVFIVCGL